jgi:hypothetical protein
MNISASGALGYDKSELIGHSIKTILPEIYSKYHDSFIENYLNTLEPRIIGTDRMVPAKTKTNYIQMIILYLRYIPSLIHGIQFLGKF